MQITDIENQVEIQDLQYFELKHRMELLEPLEGIREIFLYAPMNLN